MIASKGCFRCCLESSIEACAYASNFLHVGNYVVQQSILDFFIKLIECTVRVCRQSSSVTVDGLEWSQNLDRTGEIQSSGLCYFVVAWCMFEVRFPALNLGAKSVRSPLSQSFREQCETPSTLLATDTTSLFSRYDRYDRCRARSQARPDISEDYLTTLASFARHQRLRELVRSDRDSLAWTCCPFQFWITKDKLPSFGDTGNHKLYVRWKRFRTGITQACSSLAFG